MDPYLETNRLYWNERARLHAKSETGIYDLAGFRAGKSALCPIEDAELGDVAGKRLLHLQCHFGLDTLRLARRGAHVTGLDFAPDAISAARKLAHEAGLKATFVEGNLYDAPALIQGQFDIVFVSWGALCWLPDIPRWAEIVAGFLRPGGYLYLAEGHPAALILKQSERGQLVPHYDYFNPQPVEEEEELSYSGDPTPLTNKRSFAWDHPISKTVNALLSQGLSLAFLNEHSSIPWQAFPILEQADDGMFVLPPGHSTLPLAYSLKAVKS